MTYYVKLFLFLWILWSRETAAGSNNNSSGFIGNPLCRTQGLFSSALPILRLVLTCTTPFADCIHGHLHTLMPIGPLFTPLRPTKRKPRSLATTGLTVNIETSFTRSFAFVVLKKGKTNVFPAMIQGSNQEESTEKFEVFVEKIKLRFSVSLTDFHVSCHGLPNLLEYTDTLVMMLENLWAKLGYQDGTRNEETRKCDESFTVLEQTHWYTFSIWWDKTKKTRSAEWASVALMHFWNIWVFRCCILLEFRMHPSTFPESKQNAVSCYSELDCILWGQLF